MRADFPGLSRGRHQLPGHHFLRLEVPTIHPSPGATPTWSSAPGTSRRCSSARGTLDRGHRQIPHSRAPAQPRAGLLHPRSAHGARTSSRPAGLADTGFCVRSFVMCRFHTRTVVSVMRAGRTWTTHHRLASDTTGTAHDAVDPPRRRLRSGSTTLPPRTIAVEYTQTVIVCPGRVP